jgi:hypothetical protein
MAAVAFEGGGDGRLTAAARGPTLSVGMEILQVQVGVISGRIADRACASTFGR